MIEKETIRELVENKATDTTDCQKIIGNLEALYAIADFHEKNAKEMQLIGANAMLDFVGQSFNEDKLAGFQAGLAVFPKFFMECYKERDLIEKTKHA